MDTSGEITVYDLENIKDVHIIASRDYIIKDVSDLFKTDNVMLPIKDYLKLVPSRFDIHLPIKGFRIRRSYIMWAKFPIKPNNLWSYFYGIVLGGTRDLPRKKKVFKISVEPTISRYLRKIVFKELGICYGIENREILYPRLVIYAPVRLILDFWGINKGIIPNFLNIHKVIEGYFNTDKFHVRHPKKKEALVSGKKELLMQIRSFLESKGIEVSFTINRLRISGSNNIEKLLDLFMIIRSKTGARLRFFEELKRRKYLQYAQDIIPKNLLDLLYFIAWKEKMSAKTLARYFLMDRDILFNKLEELEDLGLVFLTAGGFDFIVKYNPDGFKHVVIDELRKRIKDREKTIKSTSLEFYICKECGRYYTFDEAVKKRFKCCGKPLVRKEMTLTRYVALKAAITKRKKIIEKL